MRASPPRADYKQDAARTRYNRGILRFRTATPGAPEFGVAESDFRNAIRLLEPLSRSSSDRVPALELARAYNNLATLLALDDARLAEARGLYESAVRQDEELARFETAFQVPAVKKLAGERPGVVLNEKMIDGVAAAHAANGLAAGDADS